ncbi:pyridoxamine 5'-phosphate oxidase family protein [Streptomyces umbrinus]|uniref:pyridoxamine 5'-phosphate oxidase family protein n=1 Tax=Streptomyces umbrinus TaxID=67370 RepID=UPI003C2F6770
MTPLPGELLKLLNRPSPCFIATTMPDGSPQLTQTWVDTDGEHILINTVEGYRKTKNVQRDPRVAVSIADPDDTSRYFSIRGRVTSATADGAAESIESCAPTKVHVTKTKAVRVSLLPDAVRREAFAEASPRRTCPQAAGHEETADRSRAFALRGTRSPGTSHAGQCSGPRSERPSRSPRPTPPTRSPARRTATLRVAAVLRSQRSTVGHTAHRPGDFRACLSHRHEKIDSHATYATTRSGPEPEF